MALATSSCRMLWINLPEILLTSRLVLVSVRALPIDLFQQTFAELLMKADWPLHDLLEDLFNLRSGTRA